MQKFEHIKISMLLFMLLVLIHNFHRTCRMVIVRYKKRHKIIIHKLKSETLPIFEKMVATKMCTPYVIHNVIRLGFIMVIFVSKLYLNLHGEELPHSVSWNSLNNISPLFDDMLEWSELHTFNSSIPECITSGVLGMGQETSSTSINSICKLVRKAVAFTEHICTTVEPRYKEVGYKQNPLITR